MRLATEAFGQSNQRCAPTTPCKLATTTRHLDTVDCIHKQHYREKGVVGGGRRRRKKKENCRVATAVNLSSHQKTISMLIKQLEGYYYRLVLSFFKWILCSLAISLVSFSLPSWRGTTDGDNKVTSSYINRDNNNNNNNISKEQRAKRE